jgi:hypothetical protein
VTRRVSVGCVAAMLLMAGAGLGAQDERAAAREIVKKWQDAVINVRVVLKMRISVGGREMQAMDDSVDTVGTVIDPSGLTVMSLGALNPGAMMNKLIGAAGSGAPERTEFGSEPTDLKLRLADGREIPAKIVLRDEDLDLAFVRPVAKPDKPFVAVNLADAGRPAMLDPVIILTRLGRVGAWTPAASLQNIGAIIERPRTFFVTASGPMNALGVPAFTAAGKVVGLVTMRSVDAGRPSMFGMMGGTESLGLLPVILPAADVMEIAKQASDK